MSWGRRIAVLGLAVAVLAAASAVARSAPAGPSPTLAHVYLTARVGRYAATITVTKQGGRRGAATLVVFLSRGGAGDQQTHSYAFTLAPSAVSIDHVLGRARAQAALGSFGTVDLTLTGAGASKVQAACSGPATLVRSARLRGRIRLHLGSLGTIISVDRGVTMDRLQRSGTPSCPVPACRRDAGTEIAGVNVGPSYISVQSDGLGHTYVFGSVSQQVSKPRVSIEHTRFALGGSLAVSPGAGAHDRSLVVSGAGPVSGRLSFSGTGAIAPDRGCRGHTVLRVSGPIEGQLSLRIDGVGAVSVAGDGSATAPLGDYIEQVS